MGIETYSKVVVVAKQQEITKLYEKLDSLPVKIKSTGPAKFFRDNPEYYHKAGPSKNGDFSMNEAVTGEVSLIDPNLKDYWFLYIYSGGYNCAWDPELFMSVNGIDYVLMAEYSYSDYEPYEESYMMQNRLTKHYERVSLVSDDPMISDDPRYGEKPSEFIMYAQRLVAKAREIYDQKFDAK